MADEADKVVEEDSDVEGQVVRNRISHKIHRSDATVPETEFEMSGSDDDVEGQILRNRIR